MQRFTSPESQPLFSNPHASPTRRSPEELFREEFQHSISVFMRKGFAIERCFGFVWEKTLESIPIPDASKPKLYNELILWAKQWVS